MPANVDGLAVLTRLINQGRRATPLLLISSLAAMRPEISDYAMSKHLGEEVLRQHADFPWSIFRPPAVYGPGDREMLPLLKLARRGLVTPLGPETQKLSLLHADDLARAVSAWLEQTEACQGQTFSLDDGHPGGYDWPAIAAAATDKESRILPIPRSLLFTAGWLNLGMATLFRYAPMLTPGKARELTQADWLCDNTQLENATGWSPRIDLETGIRELFAGA
jgi:nucleoside-diphosphate-sugar epimerase